MHCVENLFCVVLGARTHQFQEAKGPETENQLRTALPVGDRALVYCVDFFLANWYFFLIFKK
jgi:hypothetical protein